MSDVNNVLVSNVPKGCSGKLDCVRDTISTFNGHSDRFLEKEEGGGGGGHGRRLWFSHKLCF